MKYVVKMNSDQFLRYVERVLDVHVLHDESQEGASLRTGEREGDSNGAKAPRKKRESKINAAILEGLAGGGATATQLGEMLESRNAGKKGSVQGGLKALLADKKIVKSGTTYQLA
jgi:hypothetical protein